MEIIIKIRVYTFFNVGLLNLKLNYEQNHSNMLMNGGNEWNIIFLFNIKS